MIAASILQAIEPFCYTLEAGFPIISEFDADVVRNIASHVLRKKFEKPTIFSRLHIRTRNPEFPRSQVWKTYIENITTRRGSGAGAMDSDWTL